MAGPASWLSADVMHALGWALIHSLWQGLSVAALAASVMALSRRPSVRYLIAVGALALMLAAPVATFFLLMKADAAAPIYPANPVAFVSAPPPTASAPTTAAHTAIVTTVPRTVVGALENLPHPSPSLLPWLVGAWLFGVALFSLRFAGGFLLLEHKRRQSTAPAPRVLLLCQELQRQLGLDRAIRYLECGWLEAPAVIGWLRPIVLLPVFALTGLSEEQLKAVIAHELAHIRRLDAFVNLFQILVETLLFYHPAMWWLNRRIRAERELCCDEIAVSLTGSRVEYARALTLMAEWKRAPILAMAANRGPLSLRILHILGRKPSGAGQRMMGLTGGALFLVAALAAANALFGIAYPIPAAHAKESLKAALSSSQVAVDHVVRQALQAATENAPEQTSSPETAAQSAKDSLAEKLVPPPADLSGLPKENLVTPTVVASNAPPAATTNDQSAAAPPVMPAQASSVATPVGPVQASNTPVATPTNASSDELPTAYHCRNISVFGLVISSEAIRMPGFVCFLGRVEIGATSINYGSCPAASTYDPFTKGYNGAPCKFDVTLNVHLADPGDASKMQPGKLVRLGGDFSVAKKQHVDYLTVKNARVLEVDPFDRSAVAIEPAAKASPAAAITLNTQPAASVQTPAPVLASLNSPAAARSDAPVVHRCRSSEVFARVLSPEEIQLSGFTCFTGDSAPLKFGSCPLSSTDLSDREQGCKFDVTMKVRLADPADADKMQMNRIVQLGGDVRVTTVNHADDLVLENARILQTDPFGLSRQAVECQPPELAELSKRLNHHLCVQNDILANLNVAGPALEAAARSPVAYSKTNKTPAAVNSGDADAITCRQRGTGIQPLNCAYNSFWAWTDLHPRSQQPMGDIGPYNPPGYGDGSGSIAQSGVIFVAP